MPLPLPLLLPLLLPFGGLPNPKACQKFPTRCRLPTKSPNTNLLNLLVNKNDAPYTYVNLHEFWGITMPRLAGTTYAYGILPGSLQSYTHKNALPSCVLSFLPIYTVILILLGMQKNVWIYIYIYIQLYTYITEHNCSTRHPYHGPEGPDLRVSALVGRAPRHLATLSKLGAKPVGHWLCIVT